MTEPLTNLEKRAAVKRLMENPDFIAFFLPEIQRRAKLHADACKDRTLTPEKRAEHIEAAYMAEELENYLPRRLRELETLIQQEKRKA